MARVTGASLTGSDSTGIDLSFFFVARIANASCRAASNAAICAGVVVHSSRAWQCVCHTVRHLQYR